MMTEKGENIYIYKMIRVERVENCAHLYVYTVVSAIALKQHTENNNERWHIEWG